MIRLALEDDEEKQLFDSLQASSSKELQSAGQSGISAIQNEPIARLVAEMNANKAEVRKSAVANLNRNLQDWDTHAAFSFRVIARSATA